MMAPCRWIANGERRIFFLTTAANPLQMPDPKDENVIQAITPQRPDQAFRIRVLPGRAR